MKTIWKVWLVFWNELAMISRAMNKIGKIYFVEQSLSEYGSLQDKPYSYSKIYTSADEVKIEHLKNRRRKAWQRFSGTLLRRNKK